jgi:tetratricopeptide (TPR) repeat protein
MVVPTSAPHNLCLHCLFDTAAGLEPEIFGPEDQLPPSAGSVIQAAPPAVFGDYELLGELGRGGQGVVYRARHRGLGRVVALKTIAPAYLAGARAWERFQIEASAAARLDHPNIIPIYEVGERDGFCFYSMKLVEGTTIEQLVAGGVPDSEACQHVAAISVKVAQAVHHAHQRGVLHRDLKPSNILLDREHEPHVSDFGLARQLTEDSTLTATQGLIGTPAYLPPEVAGGGIRQATVASDIYGLGAILYHLLTGRPPFGGGPIAATLRAVQETEPALPKALNPSVPRDLETICLKCLEKEPARRYASAQELAEDLGRFLRDEPIEARPLNPAERVWRSCRRKPALASVVVLALLLVLVLGIGSPIAAYRINQARRQAQAGERQARTEAAKSQQVAGFLKDMLAGVGPSVARGRDTTVLREILDKTAERVGKELTNDPEVEFELRDTLADTYRALGLFNQMEAMAREGLRLARALEPGDTPAAARALYALATAQWYLGRYNDAEATHRQSLAMRRRLLGREDPEIAVALNALGNTLLSQSKLAEAETVYREALAMRRRIHGDRNEFVAVSLDNLAAVLEREGKLAEAEAAYRDALAMQQELVGSEHPDTASSIIMLAAVLREEGKVVEAIAMSREALALAHRLWHGEHPRVATALNNLALALRDYGEFAEAEMVFRQAVATYQKLLGEEHSHTAMALQNLASVLMAQGKLADAETVTREALAVRQRVLGREHPDLVDSIIALVGVLKLEAKLSEAEALSRDLVSSLRQRVPVNDFQLASALAQLAATLLTEEKFTEAEPFARECVAIRARNQPDDWLTCATQRLVAASLLGQGRLTEAEPLLLSAYDGLKQREARIPALGRPRVREVLQTLVQLYEAMGQPNEATRWRQTLEDFDRAQINRPAADPPR